MPLIQQIRRQRYLSRKRRAPAPASPAPSYGPAGTALVAALYPAIDGSGSTITDQHGSNDFAFGGTWGTTTWPDATEVTLPLINGFGTGLTRLGSLGDLSVASKNFYVLLWWQSLSGGPGTQRLIDLSSEGDGATPTFALDTSEVEGSFSNLALLGRRAGPAYINVDLGAPPVADGWSTLYAGWAGNIWGGAVNDNGGGTSSFGPDEKGTDRWSIGQALDNEYGAIYGYLGQALFFISTESFGDWWDEFQFWARGGDFPSGQPRTLAEVLAWEPEP